MAKRLSDLEKFYLLAATESSRHTLGAAFVLWCAAPMIGESVPTGQGHLSWMHSALSAMPDLPTRYSFLKNLRNDDKIVKASQKTFSLDDFRAGVYALWRAFGRDWR